MQTARQPIAFPSGRPQAPPEPPAANRWIGLVAGVVVVAVLLGAGYAWKSRTEAQRASAGRTLRTARVQRGTFFERIQLAGNVAARYYTNVTAPKLRLPESDRPMQILTIAGSGSRVRKGEVVASFDPQATKDHLDDTRDGHNNQVNFVARHRAAIDLEQEQLTQQLRKAKAKMEKAILDVKTSIVRSDNKAELLRLMAQEATTEYWALFFQIPLRVESEAAALRMTELSEEIERLHVQRHEEDLRKLTIHSPTDGLVVVQPMRRATGDQSMYDVGDRVWPGSLVLRVVDQKRMHVQTYINQSESMKFRVGQPARIRLDAYPEARYLGRVHSIGALGSVPGRQQYYLRTIPMQIEIMDGDERLLPDLTASAEVEVAREEGALLAPAEAVKEENGEKVVYVQTQDRVERRTVGRTRIHGVQAAIAEGVSEGERVVLDPVGRP